MLQSFLRLLRGEPISRIVWSADLVYWLEGQEHAGQASPERFTERGCLELCRDLGCMPYYWYEGFWLAEPEIRERRSRRLARGRARATDLEHACRTAL